MKVDDAVQLNGEFVDGGAVLIHIGADAGDLLLVVDEEVGEGTVRGLLLLVVIGPHDASSAMSRMALR